MSWKIFKYHLGYIFYVLITVNERTEYNQAVIKGHDCIGSHDDSYILYGSARKFYFDKTKPPRRHYLTRKEYRKIYHPKNKP